jgi:N-acetyl-gamma-glutamyl-phosphate reductase
MKTVGIIGAAGYTGGELIRLLLHHSKVQIGFCYSRSQSGKKISDVHTDLLGETDLKFTNLVSQKVDIVFLCLPHGETKIFLGQHKFPATTQLIDLSSDFRLKNRSYGFVYGLPELNKAAIKKAKKIANPGCFATAIQLAVLPLAKNNLLKGELHISGITGSTGAGVTQSSTTHYTYRNNNLSVYKAFTHQHLGEIGESIQQLQPAYKAAMNFIPYRGNFTRGIIITIYTEFKGNLDEAKSAYKKFYSKEKFVVFSDSNIDLKQVVNTNKCLLHLEKHGKQLLVISVIDNLLKGASGQAVQNMNIMNGWPEDEGLKLKPSAY